MKNVTKYLRLVLLLLIFGCSQNAEQMSVEVADMNYSPPPEKSPDELIVKKLIKEGRVEFEAADLNATRKNIFETLKKYNAYVSSDQAFKYSSRNSNSIVIRVPADNFDNLLNDATKGVEKFDSKEVTVKDVTEEFLDIQARLKTKKELEARYLLLLKQAKTVSEILEIEKEMGQLRSDIESIEGRLKYLENSVSLSTLTIVFYETVTTENRFGQQFKTGFKNGWDNLIWFFVGIVNLWPFVLIILLIVLSFRAYRRKKKKGSSVL